MRSIFWFLCIAVFTANVYADSVMKCVDSAGKLTFTNGVFPVGTKAYEHGLREGTTYSADDGKAAAARMPAFKAAPPPPAPDADTTSFNDPVACGNAERMYRADTVGSRRLRTDDPVRREIDVYRACGHGP
jgi:hypothetical protein